MALPQLQFLDLAQIDAAVQARKAGEFQNAMRPFLMQKAQMEMERDNMEMQQIREGAAREAEIRKQLMALEQRRQTGNAPPTPAAPPAASFSPGAGVMSPKIGGPDWMQAHEQQQPKQAAAGKPQLSDAQMRVNYYLDQADVYARNGKQEAANKLIEQATKFLPKVKNWEKVEQGGQVLFAPYFEDGTVGNPVPYQVAEKLEFRNIGGRTIGLNAFSGKEVASFQNTESPDALLTDARTRAEGAANRAVSIRGQNLVDARAKEANTAGKAPAGYRWKADGTGLEPIPGGPAEKDKALTEAQGKAGAFSMRMMNSDEIINGLIEKGVKTPSLIAQTAGPVGNFAASADQQKMEQAQRDFINAVMRQESGAAIGKEEFDNARKQYFPQLGDSDAVIQQKARNRQLAIEGMRNQAGPAKAGAAAPAAAPTKRLETDSMPNPAQYTGASLTDSATGIKYRSDGNNWVRVK